jgi:hypothetical protein
MRGDIGGVKSKELLLASGLSSALLVLLSSVLLVLRDLRGVDSMPHTTLSTLSS